MAILLTNHHANVSIHILYVRILHLQLLFRPTVCICLAQVPLDDFPLLETEGVFEVAIWAGRNTPYNQWLSITEVRQREGERESEREREGERERATTRAGVCMPTPRPCPCPCPCNPNAGCVVSHIRNGRRVFRSYEGEQGTFRPKRFRLPGLFMFLKPFSTAVSPVFGDKPLRMSVVCP